MSLSKSRLGVVRSKLAESPWWRTTVRGVALVASVSVLALIGSGRMARWLTPPPELAIGVAHAAVSSAPPAPPPGASALVARADPPPDPSPTADGIEARTTPSSEPSADEDPAVAAPETGDGGAPSPGVAADGKVILNLATEEDLRRLPGIGRGRAQAILALRVKLKKFSRVEDLLKVKGIGRRGLARLRPLVRVD